jgi:hypothetical protein
MHEVMLATFRRRHICRNGAPKSPAKCGVLLQIMDPETRSKKASTCVSQVIVESAYCGLSSGGMAANKVTAVHAALELFQAMT